MAAKLALMELGVERLGNCGLDEHEAAAFRKQLRQALQGAADTEDSAQVRSVSERRSSGDTLTT
jgi:hypothetical protein